MARSDGEAERSAASQSIDGYVGDSLYPSSFHLHFAPPNIDAMLAHAGVASPRGPAMRAPFTMVDIGCGDGVGLILNAAAHPEAHFIGIDGNPDHIARGTATAAKIGLTNIELHHQFFDAALAAQPVSVADYIQCQGVLAWVSEANRGHVLDLAAHMLKPGGVLAVGYNCLPGWTPMLAFQQMLWTLADGLPGTPTQRFETALERLRATGIFEASQWEWIDGMRESLPTDYFAHEYLNRHWNPLWSGAVLEAAEARGLTLAGQARPNRLRADFALKAAWRDTLSAIDNAAARECAVDMLTRNWFRTDLLVKRPYARLSPSEQAKARLQGWWSAVRAPDEVCFEARTAAGTIRFDNDAARAIVKALENGPRPLTSVTGIGQADLLNALDALFMAGEVAPADPPADVPLAAATHAVLIDLDASMINGAVSRHGAIGIARGSLRDH